MGVVVVPAVVAVVVRRVMGWRPGMSPGWCSSPVAAWIEPSSGVGS